MNTFTAEINLETLTATTSRHTLTFTDLNDLKQQLIGNQEFIQGDLDDFRRAADNVRMAQLGAILCASNIKDDWKPQQAAIIGINGDGCKSNNRTFWDDFTSHGRESGRATLFVPTLPSIPVCEAAITLKITGPVRYVASENPGIIREHIEDTFLADQNLEYIIIAEIKQTSAIFTLYDRSLFT